MRNPEHLRLDQDKAGTHDWRLWGPYLADRQWGTVREDYSPDGAAWDYFPHDHARSRAYRWGEDGIAGISDDQQRLCFSLALWNGRDPILKERYFGLTGPEGNHGEDVKELYYHLDATPTHSYLKMLYKYPQAEYPYARLVEENHRRSKHEPEFELLDTGLFDDDRYFDVFIEYAKASPDDILIRITAHNRGPDAAPLHLLPHLFFRNTWSWATPSTGGTGVPPVKPLIRATAHGILEATHPTLGTYRLYYENGAKPLFTENETNIERLHNLPRHNQHFKDGINDHLVHNRPDALNLTPAGTKSALHYRLQIPAHSSSTIRLRLRPSPSPTPFHDFDDLFSQRIEEADTFYSELGTRNSEPLPPDAALVRRQAFAGLIWSKQFYHLDIPQWLAGDPAQPPPPPHRHRGRNHDWPHLNNADILSMPDKWEYPWYAAWDLAFHAIPLAQVDPEFAKSQLLLLTREWYMHPNGQLPAYEWAFRDVNPPVHAWAAWKVYDLDRDARRALTGNRQLTTGNSAPGDTAFLERIFHKLLLNFTWWVNRKDADGRNLFQGGFLGLDNIGVFDRSAPLPTGGHLSQSDGTAWMAMYALNMMRIALELAQHNPVYQDTATKFFEHFLHIASAMTHIGSDPGNPQSAIGNPQSGFNLWDADDEFYYDLLHLPDGTTTPLKVRSMVGLIPLFAVEVLTPDLLENAPEFTARLNWFLNYRPDLAALVSRWQEPGMRETHLLSLLRGHRMKCLLRRMLDQTEFLSDYGVRALSKVHEREPYRFHTPDMTLTVQYQPGESDSALFGGNSNWRGPIWLPVNFLLIESLRRFHTYYGPDFRVECPTGSGHYLNLAQVADELTTRLSRLVLKDPASCRRPVFGDNTKHQTDPHFADHLLFHEYFHGDTGRGVGASHQTGWTALLATLLTPAPVAPALAPADEPSARESAPVESFLTPIPT